MTRYNVQYETSVAESSGEGGRAVSAGQRAEVKLTSYFRITS